MWTIALVSSCVQTCVYGTPLENSRLSLFVFCCCCFLFMCLFVFCCCFLFFFFLFFRVAELLESNEHCVASCPGDSVVSDDHRVCHMCDGTCPGEGVGKVLLREWVRVDTIEGTVE